MWRQGVGDRPLRGARVLELAGDIAGPYGGKLLGDLGADVVKAEPPTGDPSRQRGPFRDGQPDPEASGFYLYLNAGKRGITLDLEQASGRAALLDLAAETDVLIERLSARAHSIDSASAWRPCRRATLGSSWCR